MRCNGLINYSSFTSFPSAAATVYFSVGQKKNMKFRLNTARYIQCPFRPRITDGNYSIRPINYIFTKKIRQVPEGNSCNSNDKLLWYYRSRDRRVIPFDGEIKKCKYYIAKGGLCDCSEIFDLGHNIPNILYVVVLKYIL